MHAYRHINDDDDNDRSDDDYDDAGGCGGWTTFNRKRKSSRYWAVWQLLPAFQNNTSLYVYAYVRMCIVIVSGYCV